MSAEGSHAVRPSQTLVISRYFDNRPHQTTDAQTVTTHDDRLDCPLLVAIVEGERSAKPLAELKDVANLNAGLDGFLRTAAFGANLMLGNNFVVNSQPALQANVNLIFAGGSQRLEFVRVGGEGAAGGQRKNCLIPDSN